MELRKKIDYEYQIFYLDCMSQSKVGIYVKSEEIYLKRKIKRILDTHLIGNKRLEERVNKMDNIMDEVYRYIKDNEAQKLPVDVLVKQWIKNI